MSRYKYCNNVGILLSDAVYLYFLLYRLHEPGSTEMYLSDSMEDADCFFPVEILVHSRRIPIHNAEFQTLSADIRNRNLHLDYSDCTSFCHLFYIETWDLFFACLTKFPDME